MAVLNDVVLVADGGDVTGGYRKHTHTYGKFEVSLKEGLEQVEKDRRLADGYVYKPDWEIAPFDVGFVRADVSIDMEVNTSDLEIVIDEALRDAEGDIFFERDISPAGLGEFEPGVDFQVGDIVMIERWGKLFPSPVTGWTMVSSEADGLVGHRVHVSGQLISDAAARQRRNQDLLRQVANDKRQLEKAALRESQARRRFTRYVSPDYDPNQEYVAGTYRAGVLSSAEEKAKELAGTAEKNAKDADAKARKQLAEAFIGFGVPESQLGYYIEQAKQTVQNDAKKAAEKDVGTLFTILAGGGNSIYSLTQQLNSHLTRINSSNGSNVADKTNILEAYLGANAELWVVQEKVNAFQRQLNTKFQEAIDHEIKHRMHIGHGYNNTSWFAPWGNSFVEVRIRGNSTVARLKKPCSGYLGLIQTTTKGLTDLEVWDVENGYRFQEFPLVGGDTVTVRSWMIFYSLY